MKIDTGAGTISELLFDKNKNTRLEEANNSKDDSFMDYLMQAVGDVDSLQKEAVASAEKMALGKEDYLHNTFIAYEKANLAFQLTVEVRNRVVEAYQEIMRMQM